ncbi:MAG: efflux RND transporter periplasmic adaptor subunit, partial [Candidatus Omnitrophica bacterium]|nr:efflux RND transporter periplasmic adaptor subunit [Candidatus Omnitrophota bacterium]
MVIREINPVYGNIETIISTTGTVQPQNRLEVKPAINGRIEEILVKEGDKVKTGDILAWMSSKERAALLDAARTEGAGKLDYWKQAYKATPLIAPINGEVIVRSVEPGQTVTSSDAVIVLSDRLIVKANVDETDIGKVKVGQPALINLDAYSQTRVKAAVDHIAYESKTVSNVTIYEVDILPAKVPPLFRSGMSANVDIIDNKKEKVLLIPLEAVIRKDNKDFVSLVKKNSRKAVEHPVELGLSNGISV